VSAAGVRIYSDTMTRNSRILTVKAIALHAWTSKHLGYGGTLFIPARPLRVPFGGAFVGCSGELRLMLNGAVNASSGFGFLKYLASERE